MDVSQVLEDAVLRCAQGDASGIDTILNHEGGKLLGVATRMLVRRDLAEDAVQDAMVQVWRKAAQHEPGSGSARGWIYAILRNRCRNMLRSEVRMSAMAPEDLAAIQDARQQAVPEEGWEMLPGSTRLSDCLEQLDGRGREAVLLAHVSGYTHGEISARTGAPIGTVKSWIRRSLLILRECLS